MKPRPSGQRVLYLRILVVAIALTVAAGSVLTVYLGRVAEKIFREAVERDANLTSSFLHENLGGVVNAAKALGPADAIIAALDSGSPAALGRANRLLDRINNSFGMSVCYLMDKRGMTVASSNRNDATTFVGKSFAFRPYFSGALAGLQTTYFALGSTTLERGYFSAVPVVDSEGAITGVVAIKRDIAPLGEFFRKYTRAFLVSPDGIIFIASREKLLFRSLWPVKEKRRAELLASRQFGNINFESLLAAEPRTGTQVRFDNEELYLQRLPFGSDGWSLVFMERPGIVSNYRWFGVLTTSVFGSLLLFFFNVLLNKDKALEAARNLFKAKDDWERTFDAVQDLIVIIDNDQRIVRVNGLMAQRLGIGKEEVIGRHCYDLLQCKGQLHACPHKRMLASEKASTESWFDNCLNGHFVVTVAPVYAQNGAFEASVHVMHDVSELKSMEQSVKEYAQRLEFVLEGSNDATWEWDMINNQSVLNARYYEMMECTPGEVNPDLTFFLTAIHPDDVPDIQRRIQDNQEGKTGTFEAHYRMVTKTGNLRHIMGRGKVVRYAEDGRPTKMAGVLTDVTELKRLGEEVNRINNLESIGLLTGGLSHDFNNVLNVICGNITFARMLAEGDPAIADPLTDAEEACERAKELGIRLQAFSQGSSPVKEPLELPVIVEDAANNLFEGTNIRHTVSAANDILPIEADSRQIRQVIENLLTNAKEAMSGGGTVKIDICNCAADGIDGLPLGSGLYVCIALQDDGKGISEENLPKIFNPYFSTKDSYSQRGMGLGLSICHAILKKHSGHISVMSNAGIGTRVTFYLPASLNETTPILMVRI